MKIAIIGAGAMGSLYGGILAESGQDVWLIDRWQAHVAAINKNGLMIEKENQQRWIKTIKATTKDSDVGIVDLAIIFVKSIDTEEAIIEHSSVLGSQTLVLTLQNGLGNIEKINKEIPLENIIAGVTAHGATVIDAGKIKHAGVGKTIIGELSGLRTPRIESIEKAFKKAELEIEISERIMGMIWDKLLVNVGINALTALTHLENGQLLEFKETEEILEASIEEACQIAKKKKIDLGCPDPIEKAKKVCKQTAENKSSMLQDLLNQRMTEIDMINGAIVRAGKKLNMPTPVNMVLTNLILMKQKNLI